MTYHRDTKPQHGGNAEGSLTQRRSSMTAKRINLHRYNYTIVSISAMNVKARLPDALKNRPDIDSILIKTLPEWLYSSDVVGNVSDLIDEDSMLDLIDDAVKYVTDDIAEEGEAAA
jgi:hypothetical protein